MAQNITWPDGTQLNNVPAFNFPKTGGGTASFFDVSDTDATASDVASGKKFHLADGSLETGTASGGSATLITKAITANGTYNASSDNADGYSQVTVNVSGGGGGSVEEKQVNFIDYDGTILYSYTKAQVQDAGFSLPSNPSHTGLTAQGWNWTLAQIKAQLTAMPTVPVWVGQMYTTSDGKTRIYCHFEKGRLAPYLGIGVNGTVVVDWGDGSGTDTLTGTSLTTAKTVQHTYTAAGDYTITLTVSSGSFAFFGVSNASHILKKSDNTTSNINSVYANAVQRIELGTNVGIGDYAFNYCYSLASVTIPSGVTSIGIYAFNYCYSLASITIPSDVTSIGTYAFSYCYSLASITIPSGVTSIGGRAFVGCNSLTSITIHSGVTSIGENAFQNCYSLASITIPSSVTSIKQYAFQSCYSLASITIQSGMTSIGGNAFNSCYSLASITIPSGVTSVESGEFRNCYSLTSITIPSDVTSIGTNAFNGCYGLGEIHFLPSDPPTVSNSNAWTGVPTDCKIYVPSGKKSAYTSASNYPSSSSYTYIEE